MQSPSICFSACCCFPRFLSCHHSPSLSRPTMGEAGEALCLGHLGSAALQKILVLIGNHVPGWVWRVQQSQCGGSGRVECCRGFTRNSDKTPSVCYSEGPVPTRNTREQMIILSHWVGVVGYETIVTEAQPGHRSSPGQCLVPEPGLFFL